MEKNNLVNILSILSKILDKDANIINEITTIDHENIDEQTRDSISNFEEQIILKAIDDSSLINYIKNNFIDSKFFDANYVIRKIELLNTKDLTRERIIQILNEKVTFISKNREYIYYYLLSQICIASADKELILLALNKINSFNN